MMYPIFRYTFFLCLFFGIIIEGFSIVIPIALNDRAEHAEQIVLAKLISSHSYWDATKSNIYTSHRLQVAAYLKEGNQQEFITVVVPGGVVDEDAQIVTPSIDMHIGKEYCVFLKRAPIDQIEPQLLTSKLANTYFQPYAYMQGVLPLQEGQYIEPINKEVFSEKVLIDKIFDKVKVEAIKPDGIVFRARTHELPRQVATNILSLKNGLGETTDKFIGGSIEPEKELIIQGSDFGEAIGFVQFSNSNTGGISKDIVDYETDIVYWRDDEIRVKIPPFAGTGVVEVQNNDGHMVGSADIIIEWTVNPVYSNYRDFDKHTRQMPKLLDVNEKGGYTIHFNTSSGFSNDTEAVAAFERAVDTWRCETKVNWTLDKTGTTEGIAKDDLCVVQYSTDLPAGILGLATTRYRAIGNSNCSEMNTLWSVREFDVEFVPNSHLHTGFGWNFGEEHTSTSVFQFDFESIALHELGHALGLGHVIDEDNVMHFSITNGVERRTLNTGSIHAGTHKTNISVQENCITSRPVMIHYPLSCSDEVATPAAKPVAFIKVLLEGLFDTESGEMETTMNFIDLLPRSQPFSINPYNYSGTETLGAGLAGVVDWIFIQLRSVHDIAVVSYEKAVLLRKDGLIIDTEGSETVDFGLLRNDSFHIAVFHRSHLPVISREPHLFHTSPTLCDFTLSEFATMGTSQQKNLSNKFLLNSGDFDGNGIINNQDFNVWKTNSSAINVYLPADADGNGIINNQDYNLWKANRSKVSVLVE